LSADMLLLALIPLYGLLDEEGQGRNCFAQAHVISERLASYHGFDGSS